MKITKRIALEVCRDHWKWLAEHPGTCKTDWPDQFAVIPEGNWVSNCAACSACDTKCRDCVLIEFWHASGAKGFCAPCLDERSPYEVWSRDLKNSTAAMRISDAASAALALLVEE